MKILCFGDSNTYGYDPRSFFADRYPAECRWVDLLARKLGCTVINAGENGRQIPVREHERLSFNRLLSDRMPVDQLIIMLGTNDLLQGASAETVCERMENFLKQILLEHSKILLIGPPSMKRGYWVPSDELVNASKSLNCYYKSLSERLGAAYADAGEWNVSLTFDGVHLTEEGHMTFAEELVNYLNKGEYLCWKPE